MTDSITGLNIFSPLTIIMRLSFAIIAGFFIGYERERHHQPAGLRTHMALSLGASLIMMLSLYIPTIFSGSRLTADPARLSAQVISGIGFLGAGAIFRFGFDIRGLTTAASIWTTSGIGLVFGSGFYMLGFFSTILLIIILQVFDYIEEKMIERQNLRILSIIIRSDKLDVKAVMNKINEHKIDVRKVSVREKVEEKTAEVTINCRVKEEFSIRKLFTSIKSLGHIISLKIE